MPGVAEIARRSADEEATLVASVEPAIREMLRQWEPWGKFCSGKPVVTDYKKSRTKYGFVKTGQPPFKPASDQHLESARKYPLLFRIVEIDGVAMVPADIEILEGDAYEIQAIERVYQYEYAHVERAQRTASSDFPLEAIIRVNVTTRSRVTQKERVEIAPDTPDGFRRLTSVEMANWWKCRQGFGLYGYCNSIHTPRLRMPREIRDLDLPLPGQYHSSALRAGRYYSGLSEDSQQHPPKVQEVIDRHVDEWEKMEPSVSSSLETVSLWYSLKDGRWMVRLPEKPKFTDQNIED